MAPHQVKPNSVPTPTTLRKNAKSLKNNLEKIGIKTIIISEDSLYRCLNEKLSLLDRQNYWKIFLPIFVSLGTSNYIMTFTDKYGISKEVWQAIFFYGFIIITFFFTISLFYKLYRMYWVYGTRQLINDISDNSLFK